MTRRGFGHLIGGALPGLAASLRPPNFVVLLADDLGWGDLGCYGNTILRTPNVDRMAAGGVRLTNFYATPTCTPSRAELLTGRYPIRSGLVRVLIPKEHFGLPDTELTLAAALGHYGYRSACIGKWHLGGLPRYRPTRHGFDQFLGILHSHDMMLPVVRWPRLKLYRDEKAVESSVERRLLAATLTREALQFIEDNRERPFFLYLPYHLPHVPWMASPDFRAKSNYGPYGDAVEEMDWSVGEVLKSLDKHGLTGNTVVVFASDNGPELNTTLPGGSTGGLRGGKSTTWEGGIRVPCIFRWPGHMAPGTVLDGIGSLTDIFPTLLAAAGVPLPEDRIIDGVNLRPYLEGNSACPREELLMYRRREVFAIRSGLWKQHFYKQERRRSGGWKEAVPCDPPELYNLGVDPGEQHNVAEDHPDVVARLTRRSSELQESVAPGRLPPPKWRSVIP